MEIADLLNFRSQLLEDLSGVRTLQGECSEIVRDVFDLDRHSTGEVLQICHVGLGGGEKELVIAVAEDHPILDDPAIVVAPHRVMSLPGPALPDVTSQDAGQEGFGVGPGDPVLVERGGVDDRRRVPDREVLELVRHLIPVGGQISRPMAPQPGLVGLTGSCMKRCLADQVCNLGWVGSL